MRDDASKKGVADVVADDAGTDEAPKTFADVEEDLGAGVADDEVELAVKTRLSSN